MLVDSASLIGNNEISNEEIRENNHEERNEPKINQPHFSSLNDDERLETSEG
jgi:hypothetical protein